MIYILGSNLDVAQLPLSGTLQYTIQNDTTKMAGILGMGIRKPDVVRCYVKETIECKRIAKGCEDKVVRFRDDTDLMAKLSGSSSENTKETEDNTVATTVPEVEKEKEVTDSDVTSAQSVLNQSTAAAPPPPPPSSTFGKQQSSEDSIEEVSSQLMMPTTSTMDSSMEYDALRSKISTLEQALAQNRKMYEECRAGYDEVYEYAQKQIDEITSEYEAKLKEANMALEEWKLQAESNTGGLLSNFDAYASKCRAIIKAGFTMEPKVNNLVVVAPGTPESARVLYQSLAILAMSGFAGAIADFSGDSLFSNILVHLARKLKIIDAHAQNREPTIQELQNCINDGNKNLVDYIRGSRPLNTLANTMYGNSKVFLSGFYHDIALLTLDWHKLITDIMDSSLTNGQPVIIVLPSISSFVGRYLITYLGAGVLSRVATISQPSDLQSTENNLSGTQDRRVKILAMNYPATKEIQDILVNGLNRRFEIGVFKTNSFFYTDNPTREAFAETVANNSNIWAEAFVSKS